MEDLHALLVKYAGGRDISCLCADDQPTIGLLLCRKKNKLVAEYALRGLDQSIAVAVWQTQLTESLPEELRGSLPAIEEIENELAGDIVP